MSAAALDAAQTMSVTTLNTRRDYIKRVGQNNNYVVLTHSLYALLLYAKTFYGFTLRLNGVKPTKTTITTDW